MNIDEIKALVRLNLMPRYLSYGWAKHRLDKAVQSCNHIADSPALAIDHHDPLKKLDIYKLDKWRDRAVTVVMCLFMAIILTPLGQAIFKDNNVMARASVTVFLIMCLSAVVAVFILTRDEGSLPGQFGRDVEELADALDISISYLLTAPERERNSTIHQRLIALRNALHTAEREKGIRHPDVDEPRKAFHRGWAIAMEFSMADDYGKDFKPVECPEGPVIRTLETE